MKDDGVSLFNYIGYRCLISEWELKAGTFVLQTAKNHAINMTKRLFLVHSLEYNIEKKSITSINFVFGSRVIFSSFRTFLLIPGFSIRVH